ncbi:MAG: hypothetical protein RIR26_2579 [Pseudomonadota bacterium]|jgi:6-pyruvoyl-tetrahydropterin synthase
MTVSKIFIRNATVLDCAIWHPTLGPVGRSWNVDLEWQGTTDSEGVVMDFSQAKKLAKQVVDTFFDHRLLISSEHAPMTSDRRYVCQPDRTCSPDNRFFLDTYEESLCLLTANVFNSLCDEVKAPLEEHIAATIQLSSPENVTKVKVTLHDHPEAQSKNFFNYLHSLKLHAGNCQRFHGHSNVVEVYENGILSPVSSEQVADLLNGKYLIAEDYLCRFEDIDASLYRDAINGNEMNTEQYQWIRYTGTQGSVVACIPKDRLLVMTTESTIENISAWIHRHCFSSAENISIRAFEGLNKGAISP